MLLRRRTVRIGSQGEPVFCFLPNLFENYLLAKDVVQGLISALVLLENRPSYRIGDLEGLFLTRLVLLQQESCLWPDVVDYCGCQKIAELGICLSLVQHER